MKRLFQVVDATGSKVKREDGSILYCKNKQIAKSVRDEYNKKNAHKAHVSFGPDHPHYKGDSHA